MNKITKKRQKAFWDIRNKTSASNWNNVILQADRNPFAHLVLVANSRHLLMSDALSHPLGPLPWSLANGDGTMRKTNNAALSRDKQVLPAETIRGPSATIIDDTRVSSRRRRVMTRHSLNLQTQHVFTSYMNESGVTESTLSSMYIKKTPSRTRRYRIGLDKVSQQLRQSGQPHKVPVGQMEGTQTEGQAEWQAAVCRQWGILLAYLQWSVGKCYRPAVKPAEADTRIILHAAHATAKGYVCVVITTDDTDVLVLCLAFSADISCPLFQKCGTKNRVRYIDITKLCHTLGDGVCNKLYE